MQDIFTVCSVFIIIIISITIIGTTALFESRLSSEASASCPYSLQHPSNLSPNFLTSSITPSSHLSFCLHLCLLPSTTASGTLLVALCSSIPITCPAYFNRLILIYVTGSFSLVVKVLCYKSEGRWFDPSWCQWIFH